MLTYIYIHYIVYIYIHNVVFVVLLCKSFFFGGGLWHVYKRSREDAGSMVRQVLWETLARKECERQCIIIMHVLYDYIILWCLFVCRSMAPFKASQSETWNFQAPISGCRTTPSRNAWRRSWIRWMWRSDGAAANCAIRTDTEEWGSSERASWISWISMNIYHISSHVEIWWNLLVPQRVARSY
jgi:hypothetical protein